VVRMRQKTEALTQALTRFGEEIYRRAGAGGQGGPGADAGGPPSGSDDKVVDAEFEDVDHPKRQQG
jgi:molecular chaperone DnaK